MKVAFFSYPASFQNMGGGEIMLLKLKEYLEKTGTEVKLFDMWHDKIESFDLLHVFGTVKDCLGLIHVAKDRGVKVAVSPVFWSSWERAIFTSGSMREKCDFFLRHLVKVLYPAFPSERRNIMIAADILFPNSQMELDQIHRLFAIPREKMRVTYNAADLKFTEGNPDLFRQKMGLDKFILSVGRIEPRKNQLNLVRAAKQIEYPVVILGNPVSGFERYYETCKSEAPSNVIFAEGISHDNALLASAYAAAELYVLPGWFETPGLVALEAALAGTKVVATRGGSTREYFGDYVDYFRPSSPSDMARALKRGLHRPPCPDFKSHVLATFTWDKVARDTLAGYRSLL